jgi:hypothetical protein
MRERRVALAALGLAAASASGAQAHIAPSAEENNRYLKLTPMADRARLAYIVYIGEIPGRLERQAMDRDRDGALSREEADAYGKQIADAVRKALVVQVDGKPRSLAWDEVHIGLGTTQANGGSFSIDLVASLCLNGVSGGEHRVAVYDRYEIERPGETELRVEEAPGIRVLRSSVGEDGEESRMEFRWVGGESPIAGEGWHLRFEVDAVNAIPGPGKCRSTASDAPARRTGVWAACALGALALLAVAGWAVRRRRT